MDARDAFRAVWMKAAREQSLARRTIKAYGAVTKRFFVFCGRRGSSTWTGQDWVDFEHWLIREKYGRSSRNTARSACNFIFRHVLKMDVGRLPLPVLPKPERALVVVPTRDELGRLFSGLTGQVKLACRIMHGSGTRVEETCRIRVQDVDLERARLRVWDGKGEKNRETVLPRNLIPLLEKQIARRRAIHEADLEDGNGFVDLPNRLGRKFRNAARELGWQWLLCSSEVRKQHRWYMSPDTVSGGLLKAKREAGIIKRITCHSLRKAFATEAQMAGMDPRTIQALLGHADMNTTATHYLAIEIKGAFSPADVPTEQLRRFIPQAQLEAMAWA